MPDVVRRMLWPHANDANADLLLDYEWLLTNGLGGYASGTVAGILARRYHGLLIAALPAPWGRVVMLSQIGERVRFASGAMAPLSYERQSESNPKSPTALSLSEFRLENGLPTWRYAAGGTVLERRVLILHMQNTVYVTYHVVSGAEPVHLELRPLMHFRPHSMPVSEPLQGSYELTMREDRYEVSASPDLPPLGLCLRGAKATFTGDREIVHNLFYRKEAERGYEAQGSLWSPGYFRVELVPGQE